MEEKEEIIEKLNEMLIKPGGKQAARFILNSLGAIPIVGGTIAASGNLWSEKEQQNFNEKLVEWIEQSNVDLNKILKVLESELREPTKANLSLLFGEALGLEIPFMIKSGTAYEVSTTLHPQTLAEFEKFESTGWITIISNGNMTNMGAGNSFGNSIEDKKRPRGMGNGFIIRLNESYYS
ncbi:hypothetical protein P8625_05475 [Tenacibaculum tangerinum]|uniref:Uncharacterized protein n=1 Tax=Tenacibaculum tangerinum TaxID=3038772 RepID=A0ABY8L9C3_9FLAO|nr:hypothetical protein [Tenacibaculum tangerinum]WGH76610.1 hypothetical protein P8625_05475 [Tenacibaculum tangerinum]